VFLFAYEHTSSVNTPTMNGTRNDAGVNYRALQDLFKIAEERGEFFELNCKGSMLEVYNETLRPALRKEVKDFTY